MNAHLHNAHLPGEPFALEGDGPRAALLLHGLTATPYEVRSLAERLFARGYSVDAPLLPGHGTAPQAMHTVRWQDWAAAAQERYDRLAARYARVVVGGESTGAALALWLAAQNRDAAAVLAFAPAVRLALSPAQVALLYFAMPFGYQTPKRGLKPSDNWQGYKVHTARGVIELVRLQKAVRARLKAITQPVLIVQGRRDRTIHPACAEIVQKGVSSRYTELHWMFDSGHCVLLENEFESVAKITEAFLKQL